MNKHQIIDEYLTALAERAEQAGDDKLSFAMSNVYGALLNLNLDDNALRMFNFRTGELTEDTK